MVLKILLQVKFILFSIFTLHMHTRISNKKYRELHFSITKVVINLFCIIIFSFNLFLQHIDAFSIANNTSNHNTSSDFLSKRTHFSGNFYSLLASQDAALVLLDMEMSEDEETENIGHELYVSHFQNFDNQELAYHCILQSRFLQLNTSRQKKTEVDFFILHHSWKKHFS